MKIQIFPNICQSALGKVFIDYSKYDHILIETFVPYTENEKQQIINGLKEVARRLEKQWRGENNAEERERSG